MAHSAVKPPAADVFPRGELLLACGLALALRLGYLVGVAQSPLFFHPVVQTPAQHPYTWFLSGLTVLTGGDPLLVRLVQILLDAGSVFLLGATAHELWGRRAAAFTAQAAALYGALIYFSSDLSPATFSFFLVCAALYWCARMARAHAHGGVVIAGTALAFSVLILVQGGSDGNVGSVAPSAGGYLTNLTWVWNRQKVPCGVLDQGFFAPYLSPIFRLPWLLSLALVGPIAIVTAWKERRRAPLILGYLVCVSLVLAATPVCDRTRLAILAGALPLTGRAVDELLESFQGHSIGHVVRRYSGTAIALLLAAVVVNVPPPHRQRPRAAVGWWVVARAYVQAENYREAQHAFSEAERSGIHSSAFYAEWGRLENERRIGVLASQHLLTAIQLDPGNAAAHEALGDVYVAQENFDLAGQEYSVAAGLLPARAAELHTRAGEAYAQAGNPDRGREMYRQALRESPDYEAARAGLDRLEHPSAPSTPAKMFEPLGVSPSSGR